LHAPWSESLLSKAIKPRMRFPPSASGTGPLGKGYSDTLSPMTRLKQIFWYSGPLVSEPAARWKV
jgi:hypothetical protein